MRRPKMAAKAYKQLVTTSRVCLGNTMIQPSRAGPRCCPSICCWLGIVAAVYLEIAPSRHGSAPRSPWPWSAPAPPRCVAALAVFRRYAAAPFAGQFSSILHADRQGDGAWQLTIAGAMRLMFARRVRRGVGGVHPLLADVVAVGVCLLQSSDSFLTLFLGLEIMSLPSTCSCCWPTGAAECEAALKYLVPISLNKQQVGLLETSRTMPTCSGWPPAESPLRSSLLAAHVRDGHGVE